MNIKNVPFQEGAVYTNNLLLNNSIGSIIFKNNTIEDINTLITVYPDKLVGYKLTKINIEKIFETTLVDTISGNLTFLNNNDIDIINNSMFIACSSNNVIYKYDIKGIKDNEYIYRNLPILQKITGGKGEIFESNKFKKIKHITVNNNLLVAYDEEDKVLKIFDLNFNWINTKLITKFFTDIESFLDILILYNNDLIGLDKNNLYYFKYINNNYELVNSFDITKYLISNEIPISLNICKSNSSIFYLVTNKSIKKIWSTNLTNIIGSYYLTDNEINLKWFCNDKNQSDKDLVLIYGDNGIDSQIFNLYLDNLNYISLLENNDFPIYDLQSIKIKKNEYIQSWVYVKAIGKLLYNCYSLAKKINFKLLEDSNLKYNKIIDKIYNNSIINFSNDFNYDNNSSIGVNEIFQAEIINRLILTVIEFQNLLLKLVIKNRNNRTYLSPNPNKKDDTIKTYFYFVDSSLFLDPNPVKLQTFEELSPGGGILTSLGGAPYNTFDDLVITEGVTA
jgi:hypothetical protein